jgi:hypothetical protein
MRSLAISEKSLGPNHPNRGWNRSVRSVDRGYSGSLSCLLLKKVSILEMVTTVQVLVGVNPPRRISDRTERPIRDPPRPSVGLTWRWRCPKHKGKGCQSQSDRAADRHQHRRRQGIPRHAGRLCRIRNKFAKRAPTRGDCESKASWRLQGPPRINLHVGGSKTKSRWYGRFGDRKVARYWPGIGISSVGGTAWSVALRS